MGYNWWNYLLLWWYNKCWEWAPIRELWEFKICGLDAIFQKSSPHLCIIKWLYRICNFYSQRWYPSFAILFPASGYKDLWLPHEKYKDNGILLKNIILLLRMSVTCSQRIWKKKKGKQNAATLANLENRPYKLSYAHILINSVSLLMHVWWHLV